MTITITKENLAPAVKKLSKIAQKKGTNPVLSHIAVNFDGSTLTLTANDIQSTYSVNLPASGEPQQYTLGAHKLATAVNAMRSGDIEISEGLVKQKRSRIKLETLPYGDFPQPDYDQAADTGISAQALSDALSQVRHAAASQDVRFYLNGAAISDGHVVATDGHRMAWVELEGPESIDRTIIIPAAGIDQIIGMEGDVLLSASQIMVQNDTERYTSQLIEGRYPDWKRVIPSSEVQATITAHADDIMEALSLAMTGGEIAKLTVGADSVSIANDQAESAFDADSNADGMEIGIKLQYLAEAVKGQDSVSIDFRSPSEPLTVNSNQVIMPVRL